MDVNQDVISLLQEVANKLKGGWKVEYNKTAQSFLADRDSHLNNYRYFLFNQNGAYIEISYSERNQSTFRIGYFHPKYINLMQGVKNIQMNIHKGINRVASDITNRLLDRLDEVYSELNKKTSEINKEVNLAEHRKLAINSIKLVSKADWSNDNGYNTYSLSKEVPIKSERHRRILNSDTTEVKLGTIYQHQDKPDCHNLDLYNLSTEQVIKVLALLGY